MNDESVGDLIEYLLKREFGSLTPPPPPTLGDRSSFRNNGAGLMHYGQIQARRAEYHAMPVDGVRALVKEARQADDDAKAARIKRDTPNLFFNRPNASADLAYCAKMATWSLDEAVALSLGKVPSVVNRDSMEGERYMPEAWYYSPFPREYARRSELVRRAHKAHELNEPITPAAFLTWAKHMDIPCPQELEAEVSKREPIANVRKELEAANTRIAELEREAATLRKAERAEPESKPLETLERETLLELIGTLCELAGFDLRKKTKGHAEAKAMKDALEARNIKLTTQTVAAKIEAGRELIAPKGPTRLEFK